MSTQTLAKEAASISHVEHYRLSLKKQLYIFGALHLVAVGCVAVGTIAVIFLLLTAPHSLFLALSIIFLVAATFLFTIFRFYIQTKMPTSWVLLRETFSKELLKEHQFDSKRDRHLFIANQFQILSNHLHHFEYTILPFHQLLQQTASLQVPFRLGKMLSAQLHWKSLLRMREILLFGTIQEYISLIKMLPLDLETHSLLAEAYLQLSKLYGYFLTHATPQSKESELLKTKQKSSAESAKEEFTIIQHYASEDPWIYAKLAACYHLLGNSDAELSCFEKILEMNPHDREVMFRLGKLYFSKGLFAQGLKLYEHLKRHSEAHAKDLLEIYDQHFLSQIQDY